MPHHTRRDLGPTRLRHSGPAAFTRSQRKDYPNMHPEGHVHMDEKFHKDTRKYRTYHRNLKKGTGGRRRKSRSTRRR
jgi:hypothetical protein